MTYKKNTDTNTPYTPHNPPPAKPPNGEPEGKKPN